MGYLLKSGEVGNIGLKHLKQIRENTINKWDDLGFLEGLKGHVKENIAQLYENQASHLINESTTSSDSGSFETVVFPIVRRVFSKLLANDIVSVQALNMPVGRLFYFVPKYTTTPTTLHETATFEGTDLYDAFYEPGALFDASKGNATQSGLTATAVILSGNGTYVVGEPSVDCTTGGLRYQKFQLAGFSNAGAGQLTGPDGNTMDTEDFLASLTVRADGAVTSCSGCTGAAGVDIFADGGEIPFRVVTQQYGRQIVNYQLADVCDATGNITIELDYSIPACISCSSVDGYCGSAASLSGTSIDVTYDVYATLELEDNLNEVSFELEGVTVAVTERKLRASWSPELAQDVAAFHNIDAEAELTALLSEQVAAEIDREILKDLRKAAAWTLRWDYNGWKRFSAGQAPYTQKDWNQTLITAVNQISAQIHKATLRGGANWIVVSSEVSAIFDDLEYFHVSNASPDQDQYNMGIEKIGTLAGRYQVYRDPYFPANKVLLGHKGTSMLDTGYVYAPYVPLQLTPTMYNPFNFAPVKGIMTRYAKKVVNNRFYGAITVDGVRTFNTAELKINN